MCCKRKKSRLREKPVSYLVLFSLGLGLLLEERGVPAQFPQMVCDIQGSSGNSFAVGGGVGTVQK